jgi:hypothetical protein
VSDRSRPQEKTLYRDTPSSLISTCQAFRSTLREEAAGRERLALLARYQRKPALHPPSTGKF